MAALTIASKANQAITLPALLIAEYTKASDPNAKIDIQFEDVEFLQNAEKSGLNLKISGRSSVHQSTQFIRELMRSFTFWRGKNDDVVLEWTDRVDRLAPTEFKSVEGPLLELDSHLTLRSLIIGYTITPADLVFWGAIRGNKVAYAAVKKGAMLNVTRWFKYVEETNPWLASVVQSINAHAQERKAAKSKEGASYDIALPDTDKGVVTRFPPEPSWVAKS